MDPAKVKRANIHKSNTATPVSYTHLTGDTVELHLPMQARLMQANPNVEQDRGMLSVVRGPVVYLSLIHIYVGE